MQRLFPYFDMISAWSPKRVTDPNTGYDTNKDADNGSLVVDSTGFA